MGIANHAFSTPEDKKAYVDFLRHQANSQRRRCVARGAVLRPVDADWSKPERPKGRVIYDTPIGPAKRRDILAIASKGFSPVSAKDIIAQVCAKRGVTLLELKGIRREKRISLARIEAYYRLREETPLTFPQIGRQLGDRDHSTILHGARRYEQMIARGEVTL